jgi:hypothetical protein
MNRNSPPSINPADQGTLTGTFRFILNKMLQDTNGMLPARVVSFDRATNIATVQPMIAILSTNDEQVSRTPVTNIPVFQIGGGNAVLNFNLLPGDLGWILANDRDISLFLQSFSESPPNTLRKNDFSDSVFFPNIMRDYSINTEDSAHAVLQTLDGTVRIALWPNRVKITAPLGLEVEGPINATGGLSVSGGGGFTVTGDMALLGDIAVHGDITATGDITAHVPP